MITLLIVIYLAFISLGLPDSLLGAAWPAMRLDIGASQSAAGLVSFIVSAGTVVSSLMSVRLIRRFGTGAVTLVSVVATAGALLLFSFSGAYWCLLVLAVPLGLGGGSVDAALNNYVSLHYQARHMSWLHCFWGVGATIGPIVLARAIAGAGGWRQGYLTISCIQFALVALLAVTFPLWKRAERRPEEQATARGMLGNREALKRPGIVYAMLTFLCYCAMESGAGLWVASYLVETRALAKETAALFTSLFYGGIMLGRFLSGFLTIKLSGKTMVRAGISLCVAGAVLMLLPLPTACTLAGILLMGLGGAPIYPCTIHETPARFGKDASQAATGLQMASAYVGSTCVPPIIGVLAGALSLRVLPWALLIAALGMLFASERINRMMKAR